MARQPLIKTHGDHGKKVAEKQNFFFYDFFIIINPCYCVSYTLIGLSAEILDISYKIRDQNKKNTSILN